MKISAQITSVQCRKLMKVWVMKSPKNGQIRPVTVRPQIMSGVMVNTKGPVCRSSLWWYARAVVTSWFLSVRHNVTESVYNPAGFCPPTVTGINTLHYFHECLKLKRWSQGGASPEQPLQISVVRRCEWDERMNERGLQHHWTVSESWSPPRRRHGAVWNRQNNRCVSL